VKAEVPKIFRQLDPAQRAAIYDLSEGETGRGFDKLKSLGAIVEISDSSERLQKLSEKHLQAYAHQAPASDRQRPP
jgi:hypothetical protein